PHLEFVAGLLLVCLSAMIARGARGEASTFKRLLAALPLAALVAQAAVALVYVKRTEWSGRSVLVAQPKAHFREARLALRDRSLREFLPAGERALFDGVGVWIVGGVKAAGVQALLRPDVPAIGLRWGEFFVTGESRRSFDAALERAAGRRMYSLCLSQEVGEVRNVLEARGLKVVGETPVTIPYYSTETTVIPMILLEVRPAKEP
ncbi:MAG TPA: hypothetical protein VK421_18310, partial [Pyrinomonadaceae bacterium]|nr:hypothetical protein [Pyrinomonadaceae bacterium]